MSNPKSVASATSAQLGYHFPAEWMPHAATWLAWPHNRETWPGKFEPIPGLFTRLIEEIAAFEPVHVLCGGTGADGRPLVEEKREFLAKNRGEWPKSGANDFTNNDPENNEPENTSPYSSVTLHDDIPTNDAWTRDHGPMFLVGPAGAKPRLVDWGYNAWGGKYPPFDLDNQVPARIAEKLGIKAFSPDVVFEGGAIDTNGGGVFLAGRKCILDPRRNADLSQADAEQLLADYCGARQVIWLDGEIAGDDTDGHSDQVARFVNESTILAAVEDDRSDDNHEPLQHNLQTLRQARDENGTPFTIVPLPMPRPIHFAGQRLPASYANFYVINGAVIVPQFDDPADELALRILGEHFPDRQIIPFPSRDLVLGLGGVHCATQPQFVQP